MLDEGIETFLLAARLGSFSRAATALYLTPNAVKKRVESLERRVGVTLFERSNRGLALTPAGRVLADEMSSVSRQAERAVESARAVQARRTGAVWLGIGETFAEELLSSRWPHADELAGSASVRVVHYGRTAADRDEMLRDVGTRIDLCVDLFEPRLAEAHGLVAEEVSRWRLCVAMPGGEGRATGGLAGIELGELPTRAIALLPAGRSGAFDAIRARLAAERADIPLEDLDDYGVRSLDALRARGCDVLAPENVGALYPHLSFVPLVGAPDVSFGIYHRPRLDGPARELAEGLRATRNF